MHQQPQQRNMSREDRRAGVHALVEDRESLKHLQPVLAHSGAPDIVV